MLGSLSFEDLPLSRVLIIGNNLHHLLTLVRGAEEAPASTCARGTAAMGGGELGSGRGEVGVVGFIGIVASGGWGLAEDGGAKEAEGGDAKAPSLGLNSWVKRNRRCLSIF